MGNKIKKDYLKEVDTFIKKEKGSGELGGLCSEVGGLLSVRQLIQEQVRRQS